MSETDTDSNRSKNSDEDDIGCYFLQPSSTPYNITEKVQQANYDLFNANTSNEKTARVKFRDELVSFEPEELTDDDVNSIESDRLEAIVEDPKQINNRDLPEMNLNIPKQVIEVHDLLEESLEDLVLDSDIEEEIVDETIDLNNDIIEIFTDNSPIENVPEHETVRLTSQQKIYSRKRSARKLKEIHCKNHCIENLDHNLSMSIKKLEIHEKPINLPPLHLHQRKCCDNMHTSPAKLSNRSLPNYTGVNSEYGLSSRQLQQRRRYLERLKQKEISRQALIDEYRSRRIEQNEKVFCQWLREISKRKTINNEQININKTKSCFSPNLISSPNQRTTDMARTNIKLQRPRTANNEFIPKTSVKKRPHTTQSCVYIEVPQNILRKGIQIGDLLVSNSKMLSKKLHILTVS